jgi:hypothetical protein
MDVRQEARDRFDRVMRVPDSIAEWTALASCGLPLLMLADSVLTGWTAKESDIYLLIYVSIGAAVVYALYFATRFVAALIFAAIAVRCRGSASARRDADLREGSPAARTQTARRLAVGS